MRASHEARPLQTRLKAQRTTPPVHKLSGAQQLQSNCTTVIIILGERREGRRGEAGAGLPRTG